MSEATLPVATIPHLKGPRALGLAGPAPSTTGSYVPQIRRDQVPSASVPNASDRDREPSKRQRRPSMHDVARLAGVSQSTVSLVLNDPENCGIPVATQERIHDAIRKVGYRTNRLARAMRLDRTDTIGFVSDDVATTPFANEMIKGAQDAAWEAGRLLLIVNTGAVDHPEHAELESAAIDQMLERQVD
ncbi:MAG: LacI family transcriptional regulator, partial [Acidimicrobiaceae bacterium]|nr:LacI family transcriptional regulator [Acidimicrobiaceae bacterium]